MSSSILIDAFMLLLYYLRDNSLNTVPARRVAAADGAGSAAAAERRRLSPLKLLYVMSSIQRLELLAICNTRNKSHLSSQNARRSSDDYMQRY